MDMTARGEIQNNCSNAADIDMEQYQIDFNAMSIDQLEGNFSNFSTNDEGSSVLNPSDIFKQYGEEDFAYYPRCEYKTRFKGTSAFEMSTEKYHSTYFRSTANRDNSDRISNYGEKLFKNENMTPSGQQSKTGTFRSPWSFPHYKDIFESKLQPETASLGGYNGKYLYDDLLKYKLQMCKTLVTVYKEKMNKEEQFIDVFVENMYPCVMVKLNTVPSDDKKKRTLYNEVVDHFRVIANTVAVQQNVPIELVIRSSFGHNNPTIAETNDTFRLNIGVVPEVYAISVLAESFVRLNKDVKAFQETNIDASFFTFFNSTPEQSNKLSFPIGENSQIKDDEVFWEIIEKMSFAFESRAVNTLKPLFDSKDKNYKTILGIYSRLEEANLQFIRRSGNESTKEDGFGSDSDCDMICSVFDEQHKFGYKTYSKKIIVSTGMRAINLAHYLVTFFTGAEPNTDYMYYETKKFITLKKKSSMLKVFSNKKIEIYKSNQKIVRYIDLNHCCASGKDSKVDLRKISEEVLQEIKDEEPRSFIVFDYTSATIERMNEAIEMFIPIVSNIILVNSGLKNEQLGADMNPYGTIRFVCRSLKMLNTLYTLLKITLNGIEELPKPLHGMRKAYKSVGAVVTSKAIFEEISILYKPNNSKKKNRICIEDELTKEFREEFVKIVHLFENTRNLIENYGLEPEEILQWEEEDRLFLDSDEVLFIGQCSKDIFQKLMRCYFNDRSYWKQRIQNDLSSDPQNSLLNAKNKLYILIQIVMELKCILKTPLNQPVDLSEERRKWRALDGLMDILWTSIQFAIEPSIPAFNEVISKSLQFDSSLSETDKQDISSICWDMFNVGVDQ